MTHQHHMGYLGAVSVALMVSYAIQSKHSRSLSQLFHSLMILELFNLIMKGLPIAEWGPMVLKDLESAQNSSDYSSKDLKSFSEPFKLYLEQKGAEGADPSSSPSTDPDDLEKREQFYKSLSSNKWPGSNGLDSVLIAYDAMLESKGVWKELCSRAMFHGGDGSSTGCIAGALFGAYYGFKDVPINNYQVRTASSII